MRLLQPDDAVGLLLVEHARLLRLAAKVEGTHLFTPVGIVVHWDGNSDNGQLFFMAVLSLVFIVVHLFLYSKEKNYGLKELISKEVLKQ